MTNKLLLSLALIASVNFANASDPTPTTIDYPVNVAAGGTLNLKTNDNGYIFEADCSATSSESTEVSQQAIIDAEKDVTFNNNFSATGNIDLTFSNVTFNGNLTLASASISNTNVNPSMSVSGSMAFGEDSTVNTGGTTVQFGSGGSINITNGTFTKLNASGQDDNNKLTIKYYNDDDIEAFRTNYENERTALTSKLTNCTLTNASIQDIWATGGRGASSGQKLKAEKIVGTNTYNISIMDMTSPAISAAKFIADSTALHNFLTVTKDISVVDVPGNQEAPEPEEGTTYSLNFGTDINNSMTAEDKTEITPNTAGNILTGWVANTNYDLSDSNSTATSYTFNMNIKPGAEKTLSLTSSNIGLNTITFNGEQDNTLTVALKSASMTNVEFSPEVASFCKINATGTQKDINLKVSNHTKEQNETTTKEFVISAVPTMYSVTTGEEPDTTTTTKEYSLNIGKNVNVKLTNAEYTFKGITVVQPESGDLASEITVGSGAILNL